MWGGSPQEVDEYCRDMIRVCGKDGGFILSTSGGIDEAKPENIHALINAAEKYGRYD
jgi:uroporphyrinogen-III decarboxylase